MPSPSLLLPTATERKTKLVTKKSQDKKPIIITETHYTPADTSVDDMVTTDEADNDSAEPQTASVKNEQAFFLARQ